MDKRDRDRLERMGAAFDRVERVLVDLGLQGLQRLSRPVLGQLQAVEQVAHHAGLVHVERELAALGTHAGRYLDRDPVFRASDWLSAIHRTWAQLGRAREAWAPDADPAALIDAVGTARRAYEDVAGPVAVQAIGASGWVTESDFVGITVWLHADDGRLYQASVARPVAYFGNDPRRLLYGELSEHHGLTLLDLAHGAWVLDGVKASADGRLSLHRDLRIEPGPWRGARAYADLHVADWNALVDRLRDRALDAVRGASGALVYIEPTDVSRLVLDDKTARARARLADATGATIQLEVRLEAQNNAMVDTLQRLTTERALRPDGWFGRAWVEGGALRFLPFTALYHQAITLHLRGRREVHELHVALEPGAKAER